MFGQQLRDRWERRNETMQQLQKVMQDVCGSGHQLPPGHGMQLLSGTSGHERSISVAHLRYKLDCVLHVEMSLSVPNT